MAAETVHTFLPAVDDPAVVPEPTMLPTELVKRGPVAVQRLP